MNFIHICFIFIFLQSSSGFLSQEVSDFPPPTRLSRPLRTQPSQVNTGSPPDPYPRSQQALSRPGITLFEPALDDIITDIKEGLRYVFQTKNEMTFPIHGTGTTGGAAVLDNLIEDGDKVLVMSFGYWGDAMANISERLGAKVVKYNTTSGTSYKLGEIETALKTHRPKILAMVMAESDTVRQSLDGVGDLTRDLDAILVIDVVGTVGMQPILMDKYKIDAVYSSTNKGLGAVAGLAPLSLSPRAVKKLRNRTTLPRGYQTDLLDQFRLWNTTHRETFQTLSVPLLYSLREALATIAEEGIENTFTRHERATKRLALGLELIGLQHFVPNAEDRMIGITAMLPPSGKDPNKIVEFMFKNSNIAISSGFGPRNGQVIRIATFGTNANYNWVSNVLRALKKALLSPETNI